MNLSVFRLQGGPSGGEHVRFGPEPLGGRQGFLHIVCAQGFQTGKPFLSRSPGGYVLAPFQFVPFSLEAAEKVLQVGTAGQDPVDGGVELCLVAGAVLFRLVLNIALAFVAARDDDGQAVSFADPVACPAYLKVASLVGVIMPVILKTDRIEDQVIMDVILVNVSGEDNLYLPPRTSRASSMPIRWASSGVTSPGAKA